jgi:hypothetical protein
VDVNEFIAIYRPLIVIAFIVAFLNWLGYTVLAPWYKSATGRIIWTKFLANVLVLLTPFLQVLFSKVPFRYEFSLSAMGFFIVAISVTGVAIYKTQIKGYLDKRKDKRQLKKQEKASVETASNSQP